MNAFALAAWLLASAAVPFALAEMTAPAPPDAFRARVYLDMAKAECGGKAQALYDKILAGKGWRALPMLWSAAASE